MKYLAQGHAHEKPNGSSQAKTQGPKVWSPTCNQPYHTEPYYSVKKKYEKHEIQFPDNQVHLHKINMIASFTA